MVIFSDQREQNFRTQNPNKHFPFVLLRAPKKCPNSADTFTVKTVIRSCVLKCPYTALFGRGVLNAHLRSQSQGLFGCADGM